MATPDVALAQHIAANVASLTYGTNILSGPVRNADGYTPVLSVFVTVTGGIPPDGFLGSTLSWKEIALSVHVRSNKDDYASGRDLAREIWSVVQYAQLTGYFDVRARDPDAIPVMVDSENRAHYQVACTAIIKE